MARRRAVAATLVSVIVFTSLLFANSALYVAGNTYLSSSVLSAAQLRETEYASVLTALSSYSALSDAQSFLSSHPLDCSSTDSSYLSGLDGTTSDGGEDQGVDYAVNASWTYAAEPAAISPTLTTAAPAEMIGTFAGYSPGSANLLVETTVHETELGGLPDYSTEAAEQVHLPVALGSAIVACASILSSMRGSLSGIGSCSSTAVDEALAHIEPQSVGFGTVEMGGSAQHSSLKGGSSVCDVQYWVTIVEGGVQGVSGAFDWTVLGSGSLST